MLYTLEKVFPFPLWIAVLGFIFVSQFFSNHGTGGIMQHLPCRWSVLCTLAQFGLQCARALPLVVLQVLFLSQETFTWGFVCSDSVCFGFSALPEIPL